MITLVAGVVLQAIAPGKFVAAPVPLPWLSGHTQCDLLLRSQCRSGFVQEHLWPIAVQLGLLLLPSRPLETTRFDPDHLVVLGDRQAEVTPLVVHGGKESNLPIGVRQGFDFAQHSAGTGGICVCFTRIKNNHLCLILLKWQFDLSAGGGFLDDLQWRGFSRPRVPELDSSLGTELNHVAGFGVHGEVDVTGADLAVQAAHGAVQPAGIVNEGCLDVLQRLTRTNKAVCCRDRLG